MLNPVTIFKLTNQTKYKCLSHDSAKSPIIPTPTTTGEISTYRVPKVPPAPINDIVSTFDTTILEHDFLSFGKSDATPTLLSKEGFPPTPDTPFQSFTSAPGPHDMKFDIASILDPVIFPEVSGSGANEQLLDFDKLMTDAAPLFPTEAEVEVEKEPVSEIPAPLILDSSSKQSCFKSELKPLPPIVIRDPTDKKAVRRARNTLAARRARDRRREKLDGLERKICELEARNAELEEKNRRLEERNKQLEEGVSGLW